MGTKRPPALKAKEIEEKSALYFRQCREEEKLPCVPGLALALGLEGRRQLEALSKEEGKCAALLRRALSRVEEANIQASYKRDSGPSARFILQNGFGYSEKPESGPANGVIQVRLTDGGEG